MTTSPYPCFARRLASFNASLRSLFPGADLTWHAGAATLVQLGTTPEQVARWGRWVFPRSAGAYFELQQPFPAPAQTFTLFSTDLSLVLLGAADLWPAVLFSHPLSAVRAIQHTYQKYLTSKYEKVVKTKTKLVKTSVKNVKCKLKEK